MLPTQQQNPLAIQAPHIPSWQEREGKAAQLLHFDQRDVTLNFVFSFSFFF
jgi:hypothetical protein